MTTDDTEMLRARLREVERRETAALARLAEVEAALAVSTAAAVDQVRALVSGEASELRARLAEVEAQAGAMLAAGDALLGEFDDAKDYAPEWAREKYHADWNGAMRAWSAASSLTAGRDLLARHAAEAQRARAEGETIDVVFDGPPGPESGRFVEVERDGKSISAGEWIDRGDGYWVLRVKRALLPGGGA